MGKTYQSTTVNAPVDEVWATIRNFHDMSWASNIVSDCKSVGDPKGDQIGARRVLNDAFHETLLELSDIDRRIRYSVDNGPPPVSDTDEYIGLFRVSAVTDDNTSYVGWSSSWHGKDAETAKFCGPLYVSMLGDLKKRFA